MKKMQAIIDAQGPSNCRSDVGRLTFDVLAADDGRISEINCLQLNRLARTAGAPIDKGAGIRLFSKIGDRVEKGQPLYRIHAYDQSELDLAATTAKANSGYTHRYPPSSNWRDRTVSSAIIQSLPPSSRDAARLAARLGIPFHEIAIHRFPDGEIRVTATPASPVTIIYASLDRPNEKLIALTLAAEALRRGGAKRLVLLAPYLCYMRQDTAFHEGEAISQKAIGALIAGCVDRVITVDAHLHRTTDIEAVFPGIASENLSAMPAIAAALIKTGLDPATVVVGPDAESEPWVRNLAGRLGLSYIVAQKTRRGDHSVEIRFPNATCIAGHPALIVDDIVSSGATMIACAKALTSVGASMIDAVVTHALFPEESCHNMIESGIRSIRSTHSVPHSTNAIALDNLFIDALQDEMTFVTVPETSR